MHKRNRKPARCSRGIKLREQLYPVRTRPPIKSLEMEIYDSLPTRVRRVLASQDFLIFSTFCKQMLDAGMTQRELVKKIKLFCKLGIEGYKRETEEIFAKGLNIKRPL